MTRKLIAGVGVGAALLLAMLVAALPDPGPIARRRPPAPRAERPPQLEYSAEYFERHRLTPQAEVRRHLVEIDYADIHGA
jgi:hypothetical protein